MDDALPSESNPSGDAASSGIKPLRVVCVEKFSDAYPAAWYAHTVDDRKLLVHYRWDRLAVTVDRNDDEVAASSVSEGKPIFEQILFEDAGMGRLTYKQLVRETRGVIEWPDVESECPKADSLTPHDASLTDEEIIELGGNLALERIRIWRKYKNIV